MKDLKYREKLEIILCFICIVIIPIYKHAVVISLISWLIVSILNIISDFFLKIDFPLNIKTNKSIFILPFLYILYVLGMCYTKNIEYGLFDLEIKISLLLIPLILVLRSNIYINFPKTFLYSLSLGCIISFIINIIHAYILFLEDKSTNHFFYSDLSNSIHPSYLSLYVGVAIISLLTIKNTAFLSKLNFNLLKVIIILTLITYLFMLSSKAGIISFTLAIFAFSIIKLRKKIKTFYAISISFFIILLISLTIYQVPSIERRFKELKMPFEKSANISIDNEYGSIARLAIIISTIDIAKQNLPWGVGTGDTKDEITKYYISKGSTTIKTKFLNAHNQFTQTTIALGIPGLLLLILLFTNGFISAIKKKNILFISVLILLFIQFLFESMLEGQSGVIFISLFLSLLIIWNNNTSISTS